MSGKSAHELDDATLMVRSREGDACAFEEIYRRYYRRLQDFFYGLSRNTQTAEDLSSETFIRVWRLRARYTPHGSFPAYVFTVARNVWMESRRTNRRIQRLGVAQTLDDVDYMLAAPRKSRPDEETARAEEHTALEAALETLPDEQKMVFIMRNIQGLSLDEIAEVMDCPVNTVRSRKLLAVKKLRDALREFIFAK